MPKIHDFAIIGAGVAGLASAVALARAGHNITVFEQSRQIDEVGAGLQIGPNAVQALRQLEVWSTLQPETILDRFEFPAFSWPNVRSTRFVQACNRIARCNR